MFSQDDDNQGIALGVVFAVVALVIAFVIGLGIHQMRAKKAMAAKPVAAAVAPAAAAAAAAPADDAASVRVEGGVVKFYFASGKADIAAGAAEALADVVKATQAGRKAVISGFHDSTGDPARNEELAKQRAFAVRDALKAAGAPEAALELKKPEALTGSGTDAQARRVEVAVQ